MGYSDFFFNRDQENNKRSKKKINLPSRPFSVQSFLREFQAIEAS